MGDTIEDMDVEIEQKDNKIEVLKKRSPDFKVTEELNELGINKISSKRKDDMVLDRLNN